VATPPPTPPPTAAPAPPPAAGDALALFRQGAFDRSAQASAASLSASAQGGFSVQVLAACSPDTIRKAAQNVSGGEIFILPVTLNGRACFRVCWGVYESREAAQAGIGTLPDYFRQSGISPRIAPLVELLP
jgi:septal ring-binding cell division protein DamX